MSDLKNIPRDKESHPSFKVGELAALSREWCNFEPGHVFEIIDLIPCTGGSVLRYNARCVEYGHPTNDPFLHRTVPAEYLRWVPKPGDTFTVWRNQGDRDARCIDRIGPEALCDYEMPAGRVYLFIMDNQRCRPVTEKSLPKKWRDR
jgi:hypothetical protein